MDKVKLSFPKEALAPNGATARYRYRVYAKDGSIQRLANCVVPATKIAVQAMNRRFGVRGEQMAQQRPGSGGDDGMISIQACVTVIWPDGEEVTECGNDAPPSDGSPPPPACDPDKAVLPCDGSGGDPGGGSDPCTSCEPDAPQETDGLVADDVPPPDCNNPAGWDSRYVQHFTAYCTGEPPTDERLTRTNRALERMAQRAPVCAKIAQRARELIAAGTFRYYTNNGYSFGGVSQRGQGWLAINGDRVDNAVNAEYETQLDRVIAHEIDHELGHITPGVTNDQGHLLNPDGSTNPFETENSKQCSGR